MQNADAPIPKVSVTVITYNHGKWLAECLESIVTQKTTFPFEVVVGDDASTDGVTREVLAHYAERYAGVVVPVFREGNVGPSDNYFDVVSRTRGAYIAHVDGDDVMLPGKLQRQADVLDANANADVAFVVHLMGDVEDGVGVVRVDTNAADQGAVTFARTEDLLREGCFFTHSSKMYRRSVIVTQSSDEPVVDYYLHIEHSIGKRIAIINDVLGGHRSHPGGVTKVTEFKSVIVAAYDRAFQRAIELGVSESVVGYGRIRYRQAKAISALAAGDYSEFARWARIDAALKRYSDARQRMVERLAHFPRCSRIIWHVYAGCKSVRMRVPHLRYANR